MLHSNRAGEAASVTDDWHARIPPSAGAATPGSEARTFTLQGPLPVGTTSGPDLPAFFSTLLVSDSSASVSEPAPSMFDGSVAVISGRYAMTLKSARPNPSTSATITPEPSGVTKSGALPRTSAVEDRAGQKPELN
ncbi:MAG: hypothetical protein FJW39_26630 [Acidobacteria bacterium]|nr:hypothetical protein [Acidobacteriota bacterium]